MIGAPLSWFGIVRMGLVQTALGAIVVLTTSTLNRVMVVELGLAAALPGALVGFHYSLQILRPRWGFGSDVSGRRTPWIVAGMAILAIGGVVAAMATALMAQSTLYGILLAIVGYGLVGIGVGAAGTSLLALLAARVVPERRAAAATIVWLMMIAGFIVTTIAVGNVLDPFTPARLVAVSASVSAIAFLLSVVAVAGLEGPVVARDEARGADEEQPQFAQALSDVWADAHARRFTIFIFISMLAYSMQDLILEPFAGLAFGLSPGQTTKLAGLQHSGVFCGMILVGIACSSRLAIGSLRSWVIGGCLASAVSLAALIVAGAVGTVVSLKAAVFALGLANGAFAVAAIGNMMSLASASGVRNTGTRMGLWGASQAISFGVGGFTGAALVDLFRIFVTGVSASYAIVFALEALLFLYSAHLAIKAIAPRYPQQQGSDVDVGARPLLSAEPG